MEHQYSSTGRLPSHKATTSSTSSSTTAPTSTDSQETSGIQPTRRNVIVNRNQLPIKSSILSSAAKNYLAQSKCIRLSSTHPRSSSIFTFLSQSSNVRNPPMSPIPATISSQTPRQYLLLSTLLLPSNLLILLILPNLPNLVDLQHIHASLSILINPSIPFNPMIRMNLIIIPLLLISSNLSLNPSNNNELIFLLLLLPR